MLFCAIPCSRAEGLSCDMGFQTVPCPATVVWRCCFGRLFVRSAACAAAGSRFLFRLIGSAAGGAARGRLFFRLIGSAAGAAAGCCRGRCGVICPSVKIRKCHDVILLYDLQGPFCPFCLHYKRHDQRKKVRTFLWGTHFMVTIDGLTTALDRPAKSCLQGSIG